MLGGVLEGEHLVGIIAILSIFGGPFFIGAWVAWLKHRRKELQVELKRDMVAAGMSADEIIRVLEAGESSGIAGKP